MHGCMEQELFHINWGNGRDLYNVFYYFFVVDVSDMLHLPFLNIKGVQLFHCEAWGSLCPHHGTSQWCPAKIHKHICAWDPFYFYYVRVFFRQKAHPCTRMTTRRYLQNKTSISASVLTCLWSLCHLSAEKKPQKTKSNKDAIFVWKFAAITGTSFAV